MTSDAPHRAMIAASEAVYFEDFEPGVETQLGQYCLSQAELIEFATRYDPQPFHTDPIAAQTSLIGCLCASGNQTYVITQRLARWSDRGVVVIGVVTTNPRLETVASMETSILVMCRPVVTGDAE
jgi:acyl dehydratase